MLLVCGAMVVQAQSKIPGELDLSTTVVDAGTGTLHDPAGWDGSKIDWMTTCFISCLSSSFHIVHQSSFWQRWRRNDALGIVKISK